MKSTKLGKITSIEVTHISSRGFWILLADREYFLDFAQNPWFKEATIAEITNVRLLHKHHLFWPDLDVDLELAALSDPSGFPLIYRQ